MTPKIYIKDNMCTVYKLMFHKMHKFFVDNGYQVVGRPQDADLCLVGLCAAFDADEDRSRDILKSVEISGKPVYVYGCMVKVNPKDISSKFKYPSWDSEKMLSDIMGKDCRSWGEDDMPNDFRDINEYRVPGTKKKFVGISTGCSFSCTYCPHKKGTGKLKSISRNNILNQIKKINDTDTEVIVITGIDTACYGIDIGYSVASLLKDIIGVARDGIDIHIAQFNPEGILRDPVGMLEILTNKRVTDLQLPIQTASERLLSIMNRKYDPQEIEELLAYIRNNNNNLFLRTDIMVGFPTETYEDLEETIEYVIRNFSEVAVYRFEMKQDTPISLTHDVTFTPDEIKKKQDLAIERISKHGILCHSGGQEMDALLKNDNLKEIKRR